METLHEHIELLIGIDDNAYKCFIFISIANNGIYMTACDTHFKTQNLQNTNLFYRMT